MNKFPNIDLKNEYSTIEDFYKDLEMWEKWGVAKCLDSNLYELMDSDEVCVVPTSFHYLVFDRSRYESTAKKYEKMANSPDEGMQTLATMFEESLFGSYTLTTLLGDIGTCNIDWVAEDVWDNYDEEDPEAILKGVEEELRNGNYVVFEV